jgi:SAM-dependent methyltransferase
MSFEVAASAYDRFMGRYSTRLAPLFADFAGAREGMRVLDVGAGPGALTGELVARVGSANVAAAEPSEPFVEALHERFPDVAVDRASAESLPHADASFDAVLAQLVVHFMSDPVQGLREMARVARPGAVVAASVWDHGGGRGPLSPYWDLVRELDPSVDDESQLAGATEGHLTELFAQAGIGDVEEVPLTVHVTHESFDEWWEPYTLGVGPAGAYVVGLDEERRSALRARAAARLRAPFIVEARAWSARGRAG